MFHYKTSGVHFLGDEQEQIIQTLTHLKEEGILPELPQTVEMSELEQLTIVIEFPIVNPNHLITAEITPEITLNVNANAYPYISNAAARADNKYGPSHPLVSSANKLWLIPERIMTAIEQYNWEQHEEQIERWLAEHGQIRAQLKKDGILADRKLYDTNPRNN